MSLRLLRRAQIFLFFLIVVVMLISWRLGAILASNDTLIQLDDIIYGSLAVVSFVVMSIWIRERPQIYLLFPALVMLLVSWRMGTGLASSDQQVFTAYLIFGVLMVTSFILFKLVARSDPEGDRLFVFLLVSFALKMVAFEFRWIVGLFADAFPYHLAGRMIADQLATGQLPALETFHGTGFVRLLAGLAIFVTGATFRGISILWAWIGLVGMLFFYKAFSTAFPIGNRRLYMPLILFYPTMLLWTSSLGKDSLMVLFLGMSTYGAARLRQRIDLIGFWWLLLGLGGMIMLRPHMALIFAIGLGAYALIRPVRAGILTPVIWFLGLVLFLGVTVGAVRISSRLAGVELSQESASGVVERTRMRTARRERGGSAFEVVSPRTPGGAAIAIPTVLFRPFPTEAHTTFARISSLEGMGLLALMLYRWRNVGRAIVEAARNSFLLLIVVYTMLFILAFSGAIGNFGILARQRAQVLPFVFMLIAYEPRRTGTKQE